VQEWLYNIQSYDLMPARDWPDFVDMIFGEDVQDQVIVDN
jgi:hypothetical protein